MNNIKDFLDSFIIASTLGECEFEYRVDEVKNKLILYRKEERLFTELHMTIIRNHKKRNYTVVGGQYTNMKEKMIDKYKDHSIYDLKEKDVIKMLEDIL